MSINETEKTKKQSLRKYLKPSLPCKTIEEVRRAVDVQITAALLSGDPKRPHRTVVGFLGPCCAAFLEYIGDEELTEKFYKHVGLLFIITRGKEKTDHDHTREEGEGASEEPLRSGEPGA